MFYTQPHVSGGLLFSRWPSVCLSVRLSVRPSVVHTSVRTSFPFDNLSIYKQISFKKCICIFTNIVSLGIVTGPISIINYRVMALVNVQKNVFWPLVPLNLEYHDGTSQK